MNSKNTLMSKSKINQHIGILTNIGCVSITRQKVLKTVLERLTINSRLIIVTPNAEIALQAMRDKRFSNILESAHIVLPDGIGLIAAVKFIRMYCPKSKIARFPLFIVQGIVIGLSILINKKWLTKDINLIKGREMFVDLVKLANERKWKVYFLGGCGNEAKEAVDELKKKYVHVRFMYKEGPLLTLNAQPATPADIKLNEAVIESIKKYKPHMLFVAFGAPKQEKWIADNLNKLPVGLAMTVGGSFKFISGKSKLPPRLVENLGLEAMWRLVTEPWRFKRVFNACVVFPYDIFKAKLAQ
ncbi:WecB/TagA/CpsF family glycosyltransferase [Candidatus Woesebacteria bacterium]|nr:MAG: WecB/TagA/CpsF family glycosyltransferase [Candidatus Woesebacteria bacterium]